VGRGGAAAAAGRPGHLGQKRHRVVDVALHKRRAREVRGLPHVQIHDGVLAGAGHLRGGGAVLVATHVDLGFDAETLDVTRFRARSLPAHFGEAF